ncbi:MAG: hypothetical protein Q8N55_03325, partial [bacterium]|nr:hypothetical protein [bacterium]
MRQIILGFFKPNYKKIFLTILFFAVFLIFQSDIVDNLKHLEWTGVINNIIQDGPFGHIYTSSQPRSIQDAFYYREAGTSFPVYLLQGVVEIFYMIVWLLLSLAMLYLLSCPATFWHKSWKKKTKLLFISLKILLLTVLSLLIIWQSLGGDGPDGFLAKTFMIIQLCGFFIVIPLAFLLFLGSIVSMFKKP